MNRSDSESESEGYPDDNDTSYSPDGIDESAFEMYGRDSESESEGYPDDNDISYSPDGIDESAFEMYGRDSESESEGYPDDNDISYSPDGIDESAFEMYGRDSESESEGYPDDNDISYSPDGIDESVFEMHRSDSESESEGYPDINDTSYSPDEMFEIDSESCDDSEICRKRKRKNPGKQINVLTPKELRHFFAQRKISKSSRKWARSTSNKFLSELRVHLNRLCSSRRSGCVFSHFEYTGSFYENLKTDHADELDIMVAFKANLSHLEIVEDRPGYVKLRQRIEGQFVSEGKNRVLQKGYLSPVLVCNWFFGLIQHALNKITIPGLQCTAGNKKGPAATLNVQATDKELDIDLVPALLFKDDKEKEGIEKRVRHYVAKPTADDELLWRNSFSLDEKRKLYNIDKKDKGCRHEVIRIAKSIRLKDIPLHHLSSYHIKTVFFHYNFGKEDLDWSKDKVVDRFIGLLQLLRDYVSKQNLPSYYIPRLNLFENFDKELLRSIEGRLSELIKPQSAYKRRKLLALPLHSSQEKGE
ncbi:cyclic GMP-AMP synthase-like isoform X4 [Nematostella vectensis]|uniref:cyclic GMP-AMP synthase-like isoform X4 n=1 Tax=Nematostella vectensis TaxID=45351 RepID=UPI0020771A7C|nr:cyclic GMP-AMP synthase-like isoform X4 [Nematostella vectensis]